MIIIFCAAYFDLRFLYSQFLAIDANFKLKQKERGIKDTELAPGWGCYVESSRYEAHVKAHREEPEVRLMSLISFITYEPNTAVGRLTCAVQITMLLLGQIQQYPDMP